MTLFERFTETARAAVATARVEARALSHGHVGTQHLLLAIVGHSGGIAAEVLRAHGVHHQLVRDAVVRSGATGPPALFGPREEEALASLGIDLTSVRARMEELFGPGCLDVPLPRPRRAARRRSLLRRRCGQRPADGDLPFTPRAKKVFELGLRESLALGHRWIGPEHLLLGILREGEGTAAELLAAAGVDLRDLRRDVLDRLRRAA